ncbi:MAG TPA: DUF72 domain-containing protein [Bryobacteraceae bacterium]|nr:DUF72 domain-containing protein [Bryobacteraceae bacterium]
MADARAYVGTSGWNYKHWRNLIYPPRFAQKRWLGFTAERFDTVEVNTSFYRIPKQETIACWQDSTPSHFKFAMKLWRGITHYKKLVNAPEFTRRFLDVIDVLEPDRRAPLLIQLPPNQGKDIAKLDNYLAELNTLFTVPWEVAVEFRNNAWLTPDVYQTLDKHRAALCLHDMQGKAAVEHANDAPFVYIRRHGTAAGSYAGSYSEEQLAADAARVRAWNREGKPVYIYYNNDIGGHAFWNAEKLKQLLLGNLGQ